MIPRERQVLAANVADVYIIAHANTKGRYAGKYPVLRNNASGPEIGLPGRNPADIRAGSPISGPEALLRNG